MLDVAEVEPDRRAAVAIDDIAATRRRWERDNRRPRALTAREATSALKFECMLVWVFAANIMQGIEFDSADFDRLTLAMQRINAVLDEATQ